VRKVRHPFNQLSDTEKGIIIGLKLKNESYREIENEIGRDHSTVQCFWEKYESTGDTKSRNGSGRPRKLSCRDVRNIKCTARNDPFTSYNQIQNDLNLDSVCTRTISRELSDYCGICSHWSKKKPFISQSNKIKRLEWSKAHKHWTIDDWHRVVWTD
jgi:transposase